jgi:hypothetical protein
MYMDAYAVLQLCFVIAIFISFTMYVKLRKYKSKDHFLFYAFFSIVSFLVLSEIFSVEVWIVIIALQLIIEYFDYRKTHRSFK